MPTIPPGVYVTETPDVPTIQGADTGLTAFIGRARRGVCDRPILVQSTADFDREFGGRWTLGPMGDAVHQFFEHGGHDALIVRVHRGATAATLSLPGGLTLIAASEGAWGNDLRVRVEHDPAAVEPGIAADSLFTLTVKDAASGVVECFAAVSITPASARYVARVLDRESRLMRMAPPGSTPLTRPPANGEPPAGVDPLDDDASSTPCAGDGSDGLPITDAQIADAALEPARRGLWALEHADRVAILCVPPLAPGVDVARSTWDTAIAYARRRFAMVIVDAPEAWGTAADAVAGVDALVTRDANAALYFPRVQTVDPRDGQVKTFAPCGAVAGIYARTDRLRGVWKAPAGTEAVLSGVTGLSAHLTDDDNGRLNRRGINALRHVPAAGHVVWGSRTLMGADTLASEWKYVPVRRLALFIEASLDRGTQWATFEANGEPLWARLRQSVGAFLHDLFRKGAFQGATPRDAYFVRCGPETTTPNDIDQGRVYIEVGFAPLKPGEFVVVRIGRLTLEALA